MRGAFRVDEPNGERWSLALDLLESGDVFALGRYSFHMDPSGALLVTVMSSWRFENATPRSALSDFERAHSVVLDLLCRSDRFRRIVGSAEIVFELVDDYDVGSVSIARMRGSVFEWLAA